MTTDQRQRTPSKRKGTRRSKPRTEAGSPFTLLSTPVEPIDNLIDIRPHVDAGHPHPKRGGEAASDLKRYSPALMGKDESRINLAAFLDERRSEYHQQALARSLSLLPVDMRRPEVEIYDEYVAQAEELAPVGVVEQGKGGDVGAVRQWAAQRAHEDMAMAVLSVGGSQTEAALYAGVSAPTVGKMLRNPEFSARVLVERRRLLGRVQGGMLAELERRVFSGEALLMETKDVLEVIKRTGDLGGDEVVAPREKASGAGGAGAHNGQVNVFSQLTQIATGNVTGRAAAPTGSAGGSSTGGSGKLDALGSGAPAGASAVGPGGDGSNAIGAGATGDSGAESGDFPILGLGGNTVAEGAAPE